MANKTGKPWTKAQHKKFAATMAAKKAGTSSIPLSAIPERVKPAARKKVQEGESKLELARQLMEIAMKLMGAKW